MMATRRRRLECRRDPAPNTVCFLAAPDDVGWRLFASIAAFGIVLALLMDPATAFGVSLRFAGSIHDLDGPYGLIGAHGITTSPDGRNVYVASFDDNALVVLQRNACGGIAVLETQRDGVGDVSGLFRAVDVAVSADGSDVYVASFFGDALSAFRRNAADGSLSFNQALFGGTGGSVGLTQLEALAVSPDGANVYVASFGDNAVAALARDAATGRLTLLQAYVDGQGDVTGVFRADAVAVSPDGKNVYVGGGGSNSLAAFQRLPEDGRLRFLDAYFEDDDGIAGLESVLGVVVSPDGNDVYALGASGLAHFKRAQSAASADGRLSFAGVQTEGVLNMEMSSGPTSLEISGDGRFIYVTRGGDDTLGVLRRDLQTGDLQFDMAFSQAQDGVSGLAGASAVAVSPDDRSVYVAAQFDDAVAHFERSDSCVGDCDGDAAVTVDEIVRAVNIALEQLGPEACSAVDANHDAVVSIDEIIAAVNSSLTDCMSSCQ